MQHWKQRCPLLEEDIDTSVREHARWWTSWISRPRQVLAVRVVLNAKEGVSVEALQRLPAFLNSPFESIYQQSAPRPQAHHTRNTYQ